VTRDGLSRVPSVSVSSLGKPAHHEEPAREEEAAPKISGTGARYGREGYGREAIFLIKIRYGRRVRTWDMDKKKRATLSGDPLPFP